MNVVPRQRSALFGGRGYRNYNTAFVPLTDHLFRTSYGPMHGIIIYPTKAENKDDKGAKGPCTYPTRIPPEMAHKLEENFN